MQRTERARSVFFLLFSPVIYRCTQCMVPPPGVRTGQPQCSSPYSHDNQSASERYQQTLKYVTVASGLEHQNKTQNAKANETKLHIHAVYSDSPPDQRASNTKRALGSWAGSTK